MAGTWLEWNSDFVVSARGGLLLADSDDLARQRIIRRLMTAVRSYIFSLGYGAGLPQRIGRPARAMAIQSIVSSQIGLEASVAPTPPPQISVSEDQVNLGAFIISIGYTSAANGEPVVLRFSTAGQ